MKTIFNFVAGILERIGLKRDPSSDELDRLEKNDKNDKIEDSDGSPGDDMYPLW